MKTYKIVKTVNGRQGRVLSSFNNIEDALEELIAMMSRIDTGDDDRFIADEAARQLEIDLLREAAECDGINVDDKIAKIMTWQPPCIIYLPNLEEVCNANYDSYSYDNYYVTIEDNDNE